MRPTRVVAALFFLLLAMLPTANSQSVTGQISGTVTHPVGAVVVGATVQLTHDLSKQVREIKTEANGAFVFVGLVPGAYSLRVALSGFKVYSQRAITLAAQERVDMHEVKLAVGDVTTSGGEHTRHRQHTADPHLWARGVQRGHGAQQGVPAWQGKPHSRVQGRDV